MKTLMVLIVSGLLAVSSFGRSFTRIDIGLGIPKALNDNNVVVGVDGSQRAFMWTQGTGKVDITPFGADFATATSIDNFGNIAGLYFPKSGRGGNESHAFLRHADGMVEDLGVGRATGVWGNKVTINQDFGGSSLWDNGSFTDLSPLVLASAINADGTVAGQTLTEAVTWKNGTTTHLGTLPGFPNSVALALNSFGQSVGTCFDLGNHLATKFGTTPGSAVALAISLGDNGAALGINDSEVIVGYAYVGFAKTAVVWNGDVMTTLDSFFPGIPGPSMTSALGINNYGSIIATGNDDHAYLYMSSVPAPSSFGFIMLAASRWKRRRF